MTYSAVRSRLYSEAYLAFGLLLWLLANCSWMVGEFRTLWYSSTSSTEDDTVAEQYEEKGQTVARYLLLTAVVMYVAFFAILVPFDAFASDRESSAMRCLAAMSPPCPKHKLFRWMKEFRIFASLHFTSWAVKDCLWAWELPLAYGAAFMLTVVLNVDLLWRLGTHRQLYIDFVHCSVLLLWVVANGMWAMGEMTTEVGSSEDQYRLYRFDLVNPQIPDSAFQLRYVAGWVFFLAVSILVMFYIHWAVVTLTKRAPSYAAFSKHIVVACEEEEANTNRSRLIAMADLEIA